MLTGLKEVWFMVYKRSQRVVRGSFREIEVAKNEGISYGRGEGRELHVRKKTRAARHPKASKQSREVAFCGHEAKCHAEKTRWRKNGEGG